MNNIWIYIFIMFAVSYAIRVLPLLFLRKPITNRFIKSFLYYVPYVTLAVMSFPAVLETTQSPVSGAIALAVAIFAAWKGMAIFPVAVISCVTIFITELFLV
ncbi:MAG: AzlD domain-containing protein [Oscillospiraceae bacterium]|nr:AzlD domain-containing protein [Oscillospiraceae bacterium]